MRKRWLKTYAIFFGLLIFSSCKNSNKNISTENISALDLKTGGVVQCGPPGEQFGTVDFAISCSDKVRTDFNLAIALLHSFEYEDAEKVFARIILAEPDCAMPYWGVAMCNYHPLWSSPNQAELKKGEKAIEIARSLDKPSARESAYIEAIGKFYDDWDKIDEHTRAISYEKAMDSLHQQYPQDKEAAIFYALSLVAAADPHDQSYSSQKKAGAILNSLYPGEPGHPGIVHYIIHTYDYPGLAELALPAARKYASIAPASSHAQHMPSHIFTRLGLWDESIKSNLVSTAAAKCYAENSGIKGHWDEELHGMDYLVYAYLQKGQNGLAKAQWDYLKTIDGVYPLDFKVTYAFAAIPARYVLENKMWKEASGLEVYPANFPWAKFPWQEAIIHFARALGLAHMGNFPGANAELGKLAALYDTLNLAKDAYKANQVAIQLKAANAWILFEKGQHEEALKLMNAAADMEEATDKHPVSPGEIIPAKELLGDMLLQTGDAAKALTAYQDDLKKHPNRFNGLYGAGLAAEKSGDKQNALIYYQQLDDIAATNSDRPELAKARVFLKKSGFSKKPELSH